MKKTTLLLVSMSVFCAFDSYAQSYLGQAADQKIQGAQWIEYSKESSRPIFVEFNSASANFRMAVSNPLEMMKEVLSLKPNDNLISYKQESDDIGFTHTRYQQVYKNIPVEGAQYIAHQKNGLLDCINGLFLSVGDISVTPSLTESAALSKAISFVGAKSYKWDNKEEIAALRAAFEDPTFNYDPKGALVIYPKNNEMNDKADFRLAYKFNIYAQEPESRAYIFVDAQTGEIIGRQELIHTADVEGTAHTKYSGTQKIMVTQKSTTNFVLQETGRGKGISTFNANNASENSASYPSTDFVDTDNDWNNFNAKWDEAATDAHWATEMTYDYYMKVHNRNSVDNAGFKLINYVHCGTGWFNANWNGSYMRYGDGPASTGKPLTAIDIGGHEMTHGVTSNSAQLVYQNESGALNESFSDIFGNMVEYYAKPAAASWAMGEAIGAIRNMQDPGLFKNPDTYKGTYWVTGTADQGGVHTNSGVQNHWFYILSMGEKGTNDIGTAYDVPGITREKAAKIAFRNLTTYLTSSSNYAAARLNSLKAAKDLYGECSPEYISTGDAWNAVGVGDKVTGCQVAPVCDFFADKTTSCDGTVQFTDKSSSSPTSWAWDFGDGATATTQNPSHTYASAGSYTVKLKATNAFGNDEEIKTSYVTITIPASPTVTGGERCGTGIVNLSAVSSTGTLNWYTAQTGGTPVYTGTTYAASLSATTTYYVENMIVGPAQKVGPADNSTLTGGLYTTNADHGLKFDVLAPCTLKSVKVYAGAAGDRTIEVLDNAGAVVKTIVATVPAGESRVTLNFDLAVGTQYFIKVSGTLVDLFRSNAGVAAFPYTLAGAVSITETDVTATSPKFYYYFFDWEVQAGGCASPRVAVTGTVNPDVAKPAITEDAQKVLSTSVTGVTYQWFLNGLPITGATSQTYKPLQDGSYTVKATNTGNCSSTSEPYQFKASGIAPNVLDAYVHIYPNPASEAIFVDAPQLGNNTITVNVFSVIGKLVYQETYANNGQPHQVNLGTIEANGIYFIKIQSGSEQITRKFNLNR
jgi:Zn-dependent metalloprotease